MTANNTPRLGLMSPVDSDLFLSSDFAATFAKLDATPGTTPVANYAALPTTWGAAQSGSEVVQIDNGARWMWRYPSGGPGVWIRTNSIGTLASATQAATVSTSTLNSPGAKFIDSGTFTIPGGRDVLIELILGCDNTSGLNGLVNVDISDNGTVIQHNTFRPGLPVTQPGVRQLAHYQIVSPVNNSAHRITASINSVNVSSGSGGQGVSAMRGSSLYIREI